MMTEAQLEAWCGAYAVANGYRFIKLRAVGARGFPDRLLLIPKLPPVFVELKTKTGEPSYLQWIWYRDLTEVGQRVWLVRSATEFVDRIKRYLEEHNVKPEQDEA